MNLVVGDRVIFYHLGRLHGRTESQLFQERTHLGTVTGVDYEKREYTIKGDGLIDFGESVPEKYVRAVRVKYWYQFWRNKGFHLNFWAYLVVLVFFLLFIYR